MTTRARSGFTLVEVIVTVVLLGIVLSSLARMSTVISVTARKNDLVARRLAVVQLEANKLGGMPFDSVVTFSTTTKTFVWGGFSYTRKLRITNPGTNRYDVTIVITPTNTIVKADSITIERTKPPASSVLCTTC